jgi:DinB superfamily
MIILSFNHLNTSMKQLLLATTLFFAASFTHRPANTIHLPETITGPERKAALDDFERTKDRFLHDVTGLTEAQLNFKADSTRWSIAQCIEHIALAENLIWQWQQSMVKQPADPSKKSEVKITDEQIMKGVIDRSKKFKAPEMLEPVGKFPSTAAAIQAYTSRRDSTITYIKLTQDDLRNHFTKHPAFGMIDTYQLLLLLAGHSERHTLQIEEVKASPGYPRQ